MAGHSKWKNIQHRKGRQDAIRGKKFAKIGREIYVAARQGDLDPAKNQKLRLAIAKAKSENMPNDNIDRAIKKAQGVGDGKEYEEVTYEGYGPNGTAFMVQALTDNRNRTAANMRYVFSKNGGNLGESGCVSWMFERKGRITVQENAAQEEALMLLALENGAEDMETEGEEYLVISPPEEMDAVKEVLEGEKFPVVRSEITFIPSNKVDLEEDEVEKVYTLFEAIEDYDDVQNVYVNIDM